MSDNNSQPQSQPSDPLDPKQVKAELALESSDLKKEDGKASTYRSRERRGKSATRKVLDELLSTSQGKAYTTGVLTLLIVALLVFFAVTPAISSITRQLELNAILSDRIARMDSKLQSLLQIQQKEVDYASDLELFGSYFSTENHQKAIYEELALSARENSIEINSVNFNLEEANEQGNFTPEGEMFSQNIRYQTVSVSFSGSTSNIQAFIQDFETKKRIYILNTLGVEPLNDDNSQQVELTFQTVYWSEFSEDQGLFSEFN